MSDDWGNKLLADLQKERNLRKERELLPCPFCGENVDVCTHINHVDGKPVFYYSIECEPCNILCGPLDKKEKVKNFWNTRHRECNPACAERVIKQITITCDSK